MAETISLSAGKALGPSFPDEVVAAALGAFGYAWSSDGRIDLHPAVSDAQRSGLLAVIAAHDSTKAGGAAAALVAIDATDAQTFRMLEVLVDVLLAKGVILGTDFPVAIRQLYQARKAQRAAAGLP